MTFANLGRTGRVFDSLVAVVLVTLTLTLAGATAVLGA